MERLLRRGAALALAFGLSRLQPADLFPALIVASLALALFNCYLVPESRLRALLDDLPPEDAAGARRRACLLSTGYGVLYLGFFSWLFGLIST